MQLWRIFFLICLVNLPTLAIANDGSTPIRGPRAADQQSRVQQLGPITPTDTLWRLAQQVRPDGVDMYQVMYAIYLKNPQAFLDNNFNHLRTGAMLDVPSLREIRAVDPVQARQKSTADDESWARRARASQPAATEPAQATAAPAAASQQLQQAVERLEQEQQQQLQQLRYRFGESMLLVEGIMQENQGLKSTLDSVQQQLDALKAQMAQDAELQRELEQMVRLQAEWMAEQQAMQQLDTGSGWQQLLASPAFWVLAASVPALGILLGLLVWIKRRSKRAQETIEAATAEPKAASNYQSPLPEVDDSLDVDDSLFSLDDSLLDDAFGEDVDDSPVDLSDDLLDDEVLLDDSSIGSADDLLDDDSLLEDDSLLDEDSLLEDDSLPQSDTDLSEDTAEFDPDNILSGTDLDSLFAEADDETDTQSASTDDFDDEMLEEIELDIPEDQPMEQDDPKAKAAEATEPDPFYDELEQEPSSLLDDDADSLVSDESLATDAMEPEQSFDSSELDAFAESLVEESLAAEASAGLEQDDDDVVEDVDALLDALTEDSTEPQSESPTSDDNELDDVTDDTGQDALTQLLREDTEQHDSAVAMPDELSTEQNDHLIASEEDELQREAETEAEYLTDFADLEDDFPAETVEASELETPNLTDLDDDSVRPPSAAARSVENPSAVLDEYPELELTDDDTDTGTDSRVEADMDDEALAASALVAEADAAAGTEPAQVSAADQHDSFDDDLLQAQDETDLADEFGSEVQLSEDDETDFDALLSELEQMAERVSEQGPEAAELPETASDAEVGEVSDDDFQDIDQLLAEANERAASAQTPDLHMALDVEDYQQVLDQAELADEHSEYAAQLDLIRAYLEIDDQDSAGQVIKELLASDAPAAMKEEVKQLQQGKSPD